MPAWIHRIVTPLPDFSFSQGEAMIKMQERAWDDGERRLIRSFYRNPGNERRHSVLRNYDGQGMDTFFLRARERICAISFGHGLTVEMAALSAVPVASVAVVPATGAIA